MEGPKRLRVELTGQVQGVGFRPFVYRLAQRFGLGGYVLNDARGVELEVEGPTAAVEAFLDAVEGEAPPLARILSRRVAWLEPRGEAGFVIAHSASTSQRSVLISPDVATCSACLAELREPTDRRFEYPFINCTDCGPRYTIVADIPYDRPLTSMRRFPMCEACQAEYDDPLSRRFHAQPNACPVCGPRLQVRGPAGEALEVADPVTWAVERLLAGEILAIKGLGGYHLACDARREAVVTRLRERKQRDEKPLAVMVADVATARTLACVSPLEEAELTSHRRPILILEKRPFEGLAPSVAPQNRFIGLMLPYTPLHHLLLDRLQRARPGEAPWLVMTSANLSEEPLVKDNQEALERLSGLADGFVMHDRDILIRADDSVLRVVGGAVRPVRRSRGYVPGPVLLPVSGPSVLAVGGELKSTVCLTRGSQAFLSQHLGDLENGPTLAFFAESVAHLSKILDVKPELVAYDLHPDYFSTRFALEETGLPGVGFQHHQAHILSVMAEHGLKEPVLGLALDGTGYGTDGSLWGGELLKVHQLGFDRLGHLAPFALPGGEKAIRQPWRVGLSLLHAAGEEESLEKVLEGWPEVDSRQARQLWGLLDRGYAFPRSSGLGRLFDGVAALSGVKRQAGFEGQAAMLLEQACRGLEWLEPYPFAFTGETELVIDHGPMIRAVCRDVREGRAAGEIAGRFHLGLIRVLVEACEWGRRQSGLEGVCLGGGSFQNRLLLDGVMAGLRAAGFRVWSSEQVPANDGGLSLGQAYGALWAAEG